VVGSGGNIGSSSSVGVSHEAIGDQDIGKLSKDRTNTMIPRLEENVRGRLIGKVDCRLLWGLEPTTQWNCKNELGPKADWRACSQICQSLVDGSPHCQIRLLRKGVTCGRTASQWMVVPSPEQISATVRACLAMQTAVNRKQVTFRKLSKAEKSVQ